MAITLPTLYTGVIPDREKDTRQQFSINSYTFFKYLGTSFVPELRTILPQIDSAVNNINTNKATIEEWKNTVVSTTATLQQGSINDSVKGSDKAYSNVQTDTLLAQKPNKIIL